jgi:RNA polymerase subunit RPABC4/transcription elongation factor Spt4
MENQEDEFQCSECGTEVQADTKICPNCGASLEEENLLTDEEFEEIPLPYDLARFAAFLSLLDAKEITYSVEGNALQNVWGPNLIHTQRLLVRSDQYEIVKDIISSFEKNDISIIEEKTSHSATDVEDDEDQDSRVLKKDKALKGVEGWLLVLCLVLIFGPIAYIPYTFNIETEFREELYWIPLNETIIYLDLLISILISCFSIYAGVSLWKVRPNATAIANFYLNTLLIYIILGFLVIIILTFSSNIPFNNLSQSWFGYIIKDTISTITFVIMIKLYLKNSRRVKNTYNVN